MIHQRGRIAVSTIRRLLSSLPDARPSVLVTQTNGVRKLVMDSSHTRNALSMEMMVTLQSYIEDTTETTLRCIVLSANGPVFSSGHNLKQLASENSEGHEETFRQCGKLCMAISEAPVPVIAVVDGLAAAAGCQLAAACDILIATSSSNFSTPGANFGLFCSAPGVTLSRSVGRKAAARMVLTGLPLSADQALQAGLVSEVCPTDKLEETVQLHINAIKSKSRTVIELGKRFFYQQLTMGLPAAYAEAAKVMANNLALSDGQEGLRSFVEKRKPVWGD